MRRYLEGFTVGQTFQPAEEYEITPDRLREYASEFDPQGIHLDPQVAQREMFGGIVASGWHTLSATMRLVVRSRFLGDTPLVGIAIDNLRFLKPVRAGDKLRARVAVTEVRRSASDPTRGYLGVRVTTIRAPDDEPVATQDWTILVPRRRRRVHRKDPGENAGGPVAYGSR